MEILKRTTKGDMLIQLYLSSFILSKFILLSEKLWHQSFTSEYYTKSWQADEFSSWPCWYSLEKGKETGTTLQETERKHLNQPNQSRRKERLNPALVKERRRVFSLT